MTMTGKRRMRKSSPRGAENKGIMSGEESKENLARLSKGIAHPARIEIVSMLANKPPGERCICGEIVNALPLAQSSVSQHLKVLKETGWIKGETQGTCMCYCLVEGILELYGTLMDRVVIYKRNGC